MIKHSLYYSKLRCRSELDPDNDDINSAIVSVGGQVTIYLSQSRLLLNTQESNDKLFRYALSRTPRLICGCTKTQSRSRKLCLFWCTSPPPPHYVSFHPGHIAARKSRSKPLILSLIINRIWTPRVNDPQYNNALRRVLLFRYLNCPMQVNVGFVMRRCFSMAESPEDILGWQLLGRHEGTQIVTARAINQPLLKSTDT